MDWTAPVDIYCERLGPGFLAEPLNAVSNAAFVAAGAVAARRARSGRCGPAVRALAWLVVLIGMGSLAFHTAATRWASLADVLPIAVFIYSYLGFALRRFLGLSRPAALGALTGLFAISAGAESLVPLGFLNGSAGYLPALASSFAVSLLAWRMGHPVHRGLLAASAILTVSLTFRSLDMAVCPSWPWGTHFLWHLCNAAVLYLYLDAAIRHASRRNETGSGDARSSGAGE